MSNLIQYYLNFNSNSRKTQTETLVHSLKRAENSQSQTQK